MEKTKDAPKKRMLPRKNLVVPEVNRCNSVQAYYSEGSGNLAKSATSTDCMGSCFNSISLAKQQKSNWNVRLFVHTMHGLSKKDVEHWVMFINRCGFKCTFEEVEGVVGTIVFKGKDYVSYSHQKLGITAARYICMHYNKAYEEIAHLATTLYEQFEELDAYQALILAHYGQSAQGYFDSGHAIVRFSYGCPKLITREEMLERVKSQPNANINDNCTLYDNTINQRTMFGYAIKGEWEKIIKKLTNG